MFPDARFIFIHRHPYKVIESLYHFVQSIFPGVQMQDVPQGFSRENVVRLYTLAMDAYFHDRETIPPANLIELKMDDFTGDIPGHLGEIYKKFNFGDFGLLKPGIEKYLSENPPPEHLARVPSTETIRLVDQQAAHIMQRLGYQGEARQASTLSSVSAQHAAYLNSAVASN
jgi:hypothetical protein